VPSLPLIPIPIWASVIIGTSFAPSPMAKVIHFPWDLAIPQTSAFCFGETRQHTTEAAVRPSLKKASLVSSSSTAKVNVGPSITIASLWIYGSSPSIKFFSGSWYLSFDMSSFLESEVRITIYISCCISLQLLAISIAVSYLSPVRTQSLILVSMIFEMTSGTLSYSLSSIAVAPM